jgi:predicted metal-dependent HD superfamily phosphohydrolase
VLIGLDAHWLATLGGTGDVALRERQLAVAADLLARWGEPHRRYHTAAHLAAVLDALQRLLTGPGAVPVEDRAALELAGWFHDAVYQGRPGHDEQASAALAQRMLRGLGQPPARITEVARLVRMTASHAPQPGDRAAEVFADADLSVLGGTDSDYRAYAEAVRAEYAQLSDPAYRAGRVQVLRRLTATDRIYRTPRGRQLWEAAARTNVAGEIARLVG